VKTPLTIYGPSSLDPERVFRVGVDQWNNHHILRSNAILFRIKN